MNPFQRAIVLGVLILFVARVDRAVADPIIWEYTGALTSSTRDFDIDDMYPAGTHVDFSLTFDPAAPLVGCSAPQGLYQVPAGSTVALGNYDSTNTGGGFAAVNQHFDQGCGLGNVPTSEFRLFGWSGPPLNAETAGMSVQTSLWFLIFTFTDPSLVDGQMPIVPPASAGLTFVGGSPTTGLSTLARGTLRSVEALPAMPEPSSFLLVISGLGIMRLQRSLRRG
jgi:hypothetical protein